MPSVKQDLKSKALTPISLADVNTFNLNYSSLIEASAGTGKTFTICYLVLRLLLGEAGNRDGQNGTQVLDRKPIDIENILVVTFTNAAAAELKGRILEKIHVARVRLEGIAKGKYTLDEVDYDGGILQKLLRNYVGEKPDIGILRSYSRLLTQAERNIDKASISTIHSFCNKALNQIYSFEAGRAFNVELAQDIDEQKREARVKVWRNLFYNVSSDAGYAPSALQDLLGFNDVNNYAFVKFIDELSKARLVNPKDGYFGFCVKGKKHKVKGNVFDELKHEFVKVFQNTASKVCRDFTQEESQALNYLRQNISNAINIVDGYAVPGKFYSIGGTPVKKFLKDNIVPLTALYDLVSDETLTFSSLYSALSAMGLKDSSYLIEPKCVFTTNTTTQFAKYDDIDVVRTFEAMVKTLCSGAINLMTSLQGDVLELKLVIALMIIYLTDDFCQRDNLISNDEVLRQLAVCLSTGDERSKTLCSLISHRFPVAMIDEFQDTDPTQYEIFNHLYLQKESVEAKCVSYLIGDPKQSIYAFRGSDINSYNKAKSQILEIGAKASTQNYYTLDTNRRSAKNINLGVNAIFEEATVANDAVANDSVENTEAPLGNLYVAHPFDCYDDALVSSGITFSAVKVPDATESYIPGKSRFYFIDELDADNKDSYQDPVSNYTRKLDIAKNDSLNADDFRNYAAKAAARDIKRCLEEGILNKGAGVVDTPNVKKSDIAVLVKGGDESNCVISALRELGIQAVYYSDKESVLVSDDAPTVEASNIIYLMEAILDSTNTSKVFRMLGTSLVGLNAQSFVEKTDSDAFDREIVILKECSEKWEKYGFISAFSHFLVSHELIAKILQANNGERILSNYYQIAQIVQNVFSKVNGANAQLLWFKQQVLDAQNSELTEDETKKHLESEQELVKVYTIHKSKGLEFPIVFMPFLYNYHPPREEDAQKGIIYYDPSLKHVCFSPKLDVTASVENEQGKIQEVPITKLKSLADDQEKVRLLYVALTRTQAANFIYTVGLDKFNKSSYIPSALVSVIKPQKATQNDEGASKKAANTKAKVTSDNSADSTSSKEVLKAASFFKDLGPFTREDLDREPIVYLGADDKNKFKETKVNALEHKVDNSFRVTSYSGVVKDAHNAMYSNVTEDEKGDQDKISSIVQDHEHNSLAFKFPRGNIAGNFLHKLMELLLENGECKSQVIWLTSFVNKRIQSDYNHLIKKDDENIEQKLVSWILDVILAPLPVKTKDGLASLSLLDSSNCARELDYFLPCLDFKMEKLNAICQKFFACLKNERPDLNLDPTGNTVLPDLKGSSFKGFMNGSLDLVGSFVTETGPVYYMMDYKSNYLGDSYKDYSEENIAHSIFTARYDVQILFYSLALHRYLKLMLGDNYSYERDFGGVMYLYLRGMHEMKDKQSTSDGVFYTKVPLEILDDLESLFDGE